MDLAGYLLSAPGDNSAVAVVGVSWLDSPSSTVVFSSTAALSRCVSLSRATEIGASSVSATCDILLSSLDLSWSTCTYLVLPPTLTK